MSNFLIILKSLIERKFERIVVPGYELDRPLPAHYDAKDDAPLKKKSL